MHYTAMAAFRLPVTVKYHVPTVLLSLLVSALGAAAALLVLSRRKVGWPELLAAAVCMGGVGISCMHYLGMASMRLQGTAYYSPGLVVLSIVLAIVISWMALALTFPFAEDAPIQAPRYHASAILRGTANPAMHFRGDGGCNFHCHGRTARLVA
jgi:NO-binding membrane sensor protein with MHYT domain